MTQWNSRPKRAAQIKQIAGDSAGSATGSLIGFLVAGPLGAVVGGVATPPIAKVVSQLLGGAEEWSERRARLVLTLAAERIANRRAAGESPRADGFVAAGDGRSAAEELVEAVIQSAARDPEERKIPLMAALLAAIPFREDVDRGSANLLVRFADELSYRQLCLLAIFRRAESLSLRMEDYISWENTDRKELASELGAVLSEAFDLYNRGLIDGIEGAMGLRLDSHLTMLYVTPGKMRVQGVGLWLHDLMGLGDVADSELAPLVEILSR